MFVTMMTKSSGLLSPITSLLGLIMNWIYEFFSLFGIENIALSIVIFTMIAKLLMLPLTIKQQKFTKLSSVMNPELQKINEKYKGKRDEASLRKQRLETQAIYDKYGASPTSGCLPMLLTLPIMFALYGVINNIPAYVNQVKDLYETAAEAIKTTGSSYYIPVLTELAGQVNININNFSEVSENVINNNHLIDILAKMQTSHWEQLIAQFPSVDTILQTTFESIKKVNGLFGLNITNVPGWRFPGIIIPILAMVLQFINSKQISANNNNNNNKDNPTASAMSSMSVVMPIMSGVFAVALPIGVGLYWISNSFFTIIQYFFVNKYMEKIELDELIEANVKKASKRKKRMDSIDSGSSLHELAKKQTKSLETLDKKYNQVNQVNNKYTNDNEDDKDNSKNRPNSISDIANIMKNRSS
ncbi:MAG: YidC/Oxa1 family membrane protein insertase [Clostridiales bacterium]|nr:YidC/Oxa1 family membrane protein insertase [Clostridiales bacterium]